MFRHVKRVQETEGVQAGQRVFACLFIRFNSEVAAVLVIGESLDIGKGCAEATNVIV